MKLKKLVAVVLAVSLLLLAFTGCGGDGKEKEPAGESMQYTMGTMNATGGYMMLGTAVAQIVNTNIEGMNLTPVTSPRGSVENVETVQSGEREFGIASSNVCKDGWEVRADFKEKTENVYGWFCAHYGITWSIALESSGIKEWKDFEGKKVAIGAPGSNDAYLAENIFFPMAGVDKDKVDIEYLTMSEALTQMKDGHLDAYIGTAAPGLASMVDMASSRDTRFVPMSQEAIDKCLEAYPEFIEMPMVKEDVPGIIMDEESVPTVAMKHIAIVNKDVPEDIVYNMTKAVFENLEEIYAVKSEFECITLEDALSGMPIEVHPGAMKYFEEKGIEVK